MDHRYLRGQPEVALDVGHHRTGKVFMVDDNGEIRKTESIVKPVTVSPRLSFVVSTQEGYHKQR